jgi:hypothetical protein
VEQAGGQDGEELHCQNGMGEPGVWEELFHMMCV